jgi:hypothetical protein
MFQQLLASPQKVASDSWALVELDDAQCTTFGARLDEELFDVCSLLLDIVSLLLDIAYCAYAL